MTDPRDISPGYGEDEYQAPEQWWENIATRRAGERDEAIARAVAAETALAAAQADVERKEDALRSIDQWSKAYPLSVFPEPDLKLARQLLEAGGVTLDSVSAYNMRHVVEGVGKIARAAIQPPTTGGENG